MDLDSMRCLLRLTEFLLKSEEFHIATAKAIGQRLDRVEAILNAYSALDRSREAEGMEELREQLRQKAAQLVDELKEASLQYNDIVALAESGHEHSQAYLESLKKLLPPSS